MLSVLGKCVLSRPRPEFNTQLKCDSNMVCELVVLFRVKSKCAEARREGVVPG